MSLVGVLNRRMSGARDNEATRPTEYPKYISPMSPSEWPCPSSAIRKGIRLPMAAKTKMPQASAKKRLGTSPAH